MAKSKKKKDTTPRPPSQALLNMLPPKVRQGLADLERERDDDSVSEAAWEAHSMQLMREANSLPAPIRDAFGRAIKKLGAIERHTERKAKEAEAKEADLKASSKNAKTKAVKA